MNIRDVHFILLGLLKEKPLHGYQINKLIRDKKGVGLIWHINLSNIYALLDVLENEKLIEQVREPNVQDSYPPKKYFCITKKGKEYFEAWLITPVAHGREFRQCFLAKWYFCSTKDKEILAGKQINEINKWISSINKKVENSTSTFEKTVNSFRLSQIKTINNWLQNNIAD